MWVNQMELRRHITWGLVISLVAIACAAHPTLGQTPAAAKLQNTPGRGDISSGNALLKAGEFGAAMQRFEALLARSPEDAEARKGEIAAATAWALKEDHEHHTDQTMTILERALRVLPDEPELLVSFGLEAIAMGQFTIADQALHAAERVRPGDPTTTYALARLEIEQQHMAEAERDLKAYLAVRPNDASAYFGLGHVYAMEQRDDEARAAFEQSVKLQPAQAESYYQIGELDLQAHQDEQAKILFKKVLVRNPRHAGALTGMGELALRSKEYAAAERYLDQAEQSDPTYPTPHYFRGLALAKLGRKEEAEQELQRGDSRPHAAASAGAGATANAQQPTENNKPPQ